MKKSTELYVQETIRREMQEALGTFKRNLLEILEGMQAQMTLAHRDVVLSESLEESGLPMPERRQLRRDLVLKDWDFMTLDEAISAAQARLGIVTPLEG